MTVYLLSSSWTLPGTVERYNFTKGGVKSSFKHFGSSPATIISE